MNLVEKSDAEILAVATPLMDNLMEASTAIDYERHIRDFTPRARSRLAKAQFQSVCEQYQRAKGFFARREFVTVFRRPDSVAIVWKQWFTRQPGEFVAELVLVEDEGRYRVDHVMVF